MSSNFCNNSAKFHPGRSKATGGVYHEPTAGGHGSSSLLLHPFKLFCIFLLLGNGWLPGGARGLQNRCEAQNASGGFDSHTFPPLFIFFKSRRLLKGVRFPQITDIISFFKSRWLLKGVRFPQITDIIYFFKSRRLLKRVRFPQITDIISFFKSRWLKPA